MNVSTIKAVVPSAEIGMTAGIGVYTSVYAKGASYLTNDPGAGANCHIMSEHYSGWLKSSHRAVAVCNDCHTPSGLVAKYATKASNGFWHSFAFTTGWFPEPLRITPRNREIIEDQTYTERQQAGQQPGTCMNCHASVYATYKQLGGGDIFRGFERLNQMPCFEARKLTSHPVACIDCHDSQTMQLRVTRPAFIGVKRARESGRPEAELAAARDYQRRAQFFLDFVGAENSTGFHAPQEATRTLGESINFSRLGWVALRDGAQLRTAGAAR